MVESAYRHRPTVLSTVVVKKVSRFQLIVRKIASLTEIMPYKELATKVTAEQVLDTARLSKRI